MPITDNGLGVLWAESLGELSHSLQQAGATPADPLPPPAILATPAPHAPPGLPPLPDLPPVPPPVSASASGTGLAAGRHALALICLLAGGAVLLVVSVRHPHPVVLIPRHRTDPIFVPPD